MQNNFIWSDLSTFDLPTAKDFYAQLFEWEFHETQDLSMKESYWIASQDQVAVSAVFVMPAFLQKLKLPSFWMSYIHVENVETIVEKAKKHEGVVIEVKPTHFNASSKIALIRDPSGAGFTIYEGKNLQGKFTAGHGRMIANIHHVNDLRLIQGFYEEVFNWEIIPQAQSHDVFLVCDQQGHTLASIEVIPDKIKGEYQYWIPVFAIHNQLEFKAQLILLGGSISSLLDGNRLLCTDPQGASFIVQEMF